LISRSKAIQALRRSIEERPDTEIMWRTMWDFDLNRPNVQKNDRALALLFGAFLEQALENGILSHCILMGQDEHQKLFGAPQEASVSFDMKIRFGFALGIYGPDSRDDLTCIRHVRNTFAHAKTDVEFALTTISDVCDQIKYIDKMKWGGLMGPIPNTSRRKFIETARHYFTFLATAENGKPLIYTKYELPDLYA
jgi:hypothetical protein